MEVLLICLVIGLIPAFIASSKGRSFFLWYIYGVALFIIAFIHSLVIKSAADKARDAMLLQSAQQIARNTMNTATSPGSISGASTSVADELEKLATLKDRGILTEDEFIAKKRALLA